MSEYNVFGNTLRAGKDNTILYNRQNRISMASMRVHVSGAQYFFEEQTNSFFLKFGQGMYVFEETKKSIQMLLEMCIVQHVQTKSVFTEIVVFTTTVKSAKLALTC